MVTDAPTAPAPMPTGAPATLLIMTTAKAPAPWQARALAPNSIPPPRYTSAILPLIDPAGNVVAGNIRLSPAGGIITSLLAIGEVTVPPHPPVVMPSFAVVYCL